MFYLEMKGRLGNQMFRYAFTRWLQLKGGEADKEIFLDMSIIRREHDRQDMPGWEDSLKFFQTYPYRYYEKQGRALINETNITEKIVLGFVVMGNHIIGEDLQHRLNWGKRFIPWLNKRGIYYICVGYDYPYIYDDAQRKLIAGPFECARYPKEIRDILLREFTPKYPVLSANTQMMDMIQHTPSVCVSIRRGNFLKYPTLNVCTKAYYLKAIEKMREIVPGAVFFVFSDDIEWVKANIRTDGEMYYESGKDPVWEKLRLMYSCKHFIISNSTFSWWAQFLGRDTGKMVIAPDHWFNSEYQPPLYQRGWIRLPVM